MADKPNFELDAQANAAKAKTADVSGKAVDSNHNTTTEAAPINNRFAVDASSVDYNPMRKEPNAANVKSDTTMGRAEADELVATKGDNPPPTVANADPVTASAAEPKPEQASDRPPASGADNAANVK